jgi:perosamine synthetase
MNNNPEPRSISFGQPILGKEEKSAVMEVLDGFMLTHGPQCKKFEESFAKRIGVKHAITTSSCTAALHLSLLALKIKPGDEVIVPAETHVATGHAVEHAGAKPVFIDVNKKTGNIEASAIEDAISPNTKAIMVVHYLGLPCDMDEIQKMAKKHSISIVEDCALALGSSYGDMFPGSIGETGCFSFYPAKHMTTMEGGMLTTNSDEIAELVRKQRAFGYDKGLGERAQPGIYDVIMLGYNFRMSEAQAAIGNCQLERLDDFLEKRKRNTEVLLSGLADIEEIKTFPVKQGKAVSSLYCVNAMLPCNTGGDRTNVVTYLKSVGIGTSVHYPVPVPLTSYYKTKYDYHDKEFPIAKWISDTAISLPVGPHLSIDDMEYIVFHLKNACSNIL